MLSQTWHKAQGRPHQPGGAQPRWPQRCARGQLPQWPGLAAPDARRLSNLRTPYTPDPDTATLACFTPPASPSEYSTTTQVQGRLFDPWC